MVSAPLWSVDGVISAHSCSKITQVWNSSKRNLFLTVLETGKFKIKVIANLVPVKAFFLASRKRKGK